MRGELEEFVEQLRTNDPLLLRGADAGGAAVDLDRAGLLERLAVKAQDLQLLLDHALHEKRLAVPAPDHTLSPMTDFGLGGERELRPIDAKNCDQSEVVEGLVRLRPLRAVLDGHRRVGPVG